MTWRECSWAVPQASVALPQQSTAFLACAGPLRAADPVKLPDASR